MINWLICKTYQREKWTQCKAWSPLMCNIKL